MGNIGFVFTDGGLKEVHEFIVTNKVAALVCVGAYLLKDIIVLLATLAWNRERPPSKL